MLVAWTVIAFPLILCTHFCLRGLNYTMIMAGSPSRENEIPEGTLPYRLDLFQDPVSFMDITFIVPRKPFYIFIPYF